VTRVLAVCVGNILGRQAIEEVGRFWARVAFVLERAPCYLCLGLVMALSCYRCYLTPMLCLLPGL
jgi:hypothetical protein